MKMMKAKINTFVKLALVVFVFIVSENDAQTTPPNLFSLVPGSSEKLHSDDVNQRASVLSELIKPVPQSCTLEVYFSFDLAEDDYVYAVGQILEKDLTTLEEKSKPYVWGHLTYLIKKFRMKQFAGQISIYLKEQNLSIQAPIITTLQMLEARKFDIVIAPLLNSSENYIRSVSLEALISFRSKKAVPALITKLYDPNSSTRYWAITKLIEIDGKEAGPHIAKLIKDEEPNIRYWAVDGLAKLKLKAYANEIWYLLNSEQTSQTQAYALASLVYFGDQNALKLAAQRIENPKEEFGELLKYIVELKAKSIVPHLIFILEREVSLPKRTSTRTDIIYSLNELEAKESTWVLRKYLKDNLFGRRAAVQVLGNFESKESVDDLLDIFSKYLPEPPNNITNNTFESAEAAVALAKIGDRKSWNVLIGAAENPKYPYRSQIIQQLNKQLNTAFWMKVNEIKVLGTDYKSIKDNAEIFSNETGIRINLEFDPKKNVTRGISPEDPQFPQLRAGRESSLNSYLQNIVSVIDAGTLPNTFTFIFDNGQIRILTVEKAVEWWRKNILAK